MIVLPWMVTTLACKALFPGDGSAEDGEILFQDDFSDPNSGWNRVSDRYGLTDYDDGVYRILVNAAHMDIWSRPHRMFQDVRIEVQAIKVQGERNNRFGVLCRVLDDEHYYAFIISSDGYYGIGKALGQEFILLNADALQPSAAIQQGTAFNQLRADCVGDTLTFFVNGVQLAQARDGDYPQGDVGLFAGTYAHPGSDIRFDNFLVLQP